MIDAWAERAVYATLDRLHTGRLVLETPDGQRAFDTDDDRLGVLRVHSPRFFTRAVTAGEIGVGESFMDGGWSTPDLTSLVRVMLANSDVFSATPAPLRWLGNIVENTRHRLDDYRNLAGHYDKIVSIEMFEAVGLRHYDTFFGACERLLKPDGVMLLQTITVDDWRFTAYQRESNWIAKYIFPGAELASVSEILASISRVSTLGLYHAEQIGTHYARTLHAWRERFHRHIDAVRAQGFDDRFIRMWDLYLGYCEAAFEDRHIGDVQLLLSKAANRRVLYGEPWVSRGDAAHAAPAPDGVHTGS